MRGKENNEVDKEINIEKTTVRRDREREKVD